MADKASQALKRWFLGEMNTENEVGRFQRIPAEERWCQCCLLAGKQITGDEWHCLDLNCRRALSKKMDCYLLLLETLTEAEVDMNNVSNLGDIVLHLSKLAKNSWQFNWVWRKIGGVLACVEQETKLESMGIPE